MRFIVALWRFAIAGFCFAGIYEAWSKPQFWVYFTFQIGFVPGIVMLRSDAATLLKDTQPPAWFKGCLIMYAIATALVVFFLMPLDDPAYMPRVIGIMTSTMLHKIAPIMAVIDLVLLDPHRRSRWRYMFSWLACFPAYLVFVLACTAIRPGSEPAAGDSSYPYSFINLDALDWQGFGINCGKLTIAFLMIPLVV